jgi:hypothetical protein
MRIVGIQCDTCTKQSLNGNPSILMDIPAEWFSVFQGKIDGSREGYHFCSVFCLNQWSEKSLIANEPKEVKP